jgi:hypothetical protein
VPTGLGTLSHHHVDAGSRRRPGVRDGTDLCKNPHAGGMSGCDEAGRVSPEGPQHRNTFVETDRHCLVAREVEDKADAKWLVSQGANALERLSQQLRRVELRLQDAKTPGTAHYRHEVRAAEIGTHWRGNDRKLNAEQVAEAGTEHGRSP